MLLSDSFVRGYIKEVRTVQEQEGSTEDIFIHRTNLRGGYKTYLQKMQKLPENTVCKSLTISFWCSIHFLTCCLMKDAQ
jgi:hypothetical protein